MKYSPEIETTIAAMSDAGREEPLMTPG